MGTYMIINKKSFVSNDWKPVLERAGLNGVSILMSSWALKYTTITNASILHMTYPVFVIVLAPYITKEENKLINHVYLITIMIGIFTISQPSFNSVNIGDAASVISAIFSALSIFALIEAGKNNSSDIIVFYVMVVGAIINFPFAFKDISNFEIGGLLYVSIAAISGFLGQVFLTLGYKYVDSATGSLVSTSRILIAAIMGTIFLNEPLTFNIIIGIILVSVALIGVSGFFQKKMAKI
jgi:drug/metabolite transporter (DMT)-like permease